jgi:hypothetical protein
MVKGVAVGEFRKKNQDELLGELKRLRVINISNLRKNYNKLDLQSNQVQLLLKFPKSKYTQSYFRVLDVQSLES